MKSPGVRRQSVATGCGIIQEDGELVRILKLPDVQQRLRNEAYEVIADTPDQFAAAIRAEITKWAPIVKQASLRGE